MAGDDEKRRLRDEVAELSEAVRDLRDELAQERLQRAAHGCGHGRCCHAYYVPVPYTPPVWQPYVTTCGSSTSTIQGVVTTNALTIGN